MPAWACRTVQDQALVRWRNPARRLLNTLLAVFVGLDSELDEDAMALLVELILGDLAFGMALAQHAEFLHEGILVGPVHGFSHLVGAALALFSLGCLLL